MVTAVDLGDIAPPAPAAATQIYRVHEGHLTSWVTGHLSGIGKNDFLMPLIDALANYSIDNPKPRPVAVNLAKTDKGELFHDLNVRKGDIFEAGIFKVGVFGSIGSLTAEKIEEALGPQEKDIKFLKNMDILPRALRHLYPT